MRIRMITARIPHQPQCAHWGSFPPGEAFITQKEQSIWTRQREEK